MQFLKTLFWMVLAAALVLFARENWVPVEVKLWSGLVADVKLPFLLLVVFLLGFLPTYMFYRGRVWTLRRQLTRPERVVVGNQPAAAPPPPPQAEQKRDPAPSVTRDENQPGLAI